MIRGTKALVTGASRGIGFKIAEMLIKNGCKVVLCGRNAETLKKATDVLGENAFPLVWDVEDINIAEEKVNEAAKIMGGLDIVINNAGVFPETSEWDKDSLLKITPFEWQKVMNINASAVFFIMQASVKYMRENNVKGNILNVTSVAGYETVRGAYGASKITATALTKGWGSMYADEGITINGIAPGPVATEMNNWHEGDSMSHSRVPCGRFLKTDEVKKLAEYLLSEDAVMACGETVILDGAYHIR